MVAKYQYISCHPLGRQLLAPPLRLTEPSWTELVNGAGRFTANVPVPQSESARAQLRGALVEDQAAIYVRSSSDRYPFAGPIVKADWDSDKNIVGITAVSWRSWLSTVFIGPKLDLSGDNTYTWTNTDQLQIAREIVALALTGGTADGRPAITIGSELSGKNRDLSIKGLDFKYAADWIDSMATRSGGFEWDITAYTDSADGLPRLRLTLGYPEIGSFQTGIVLRHRPDGANMRIDGQVTADASGRRSRVWATGNTETLPFAVDSDPNLATAGAILRERVSSYNTVMDRTTLSQHARAEREFLNPSLNILPVTVLESVVDPDAFSAGDRLRVLFKDAWYDLDLPQARVVERQVSPRSGAGTVSIKLDLTDFTMPESDPGTSAP